MKIQIKKLCPDVKIPSFAHPGDVGMDLFSLENYILEPSQHVILNTGFALEFPVGYGAFVKDKSSLSKKGIHTMGGVFDAGYRGEYNVHLVNLSTKSYTIEKGDKIAQLVLFPVLIPVLEEVTELSDTSRGMGQFGSTGKK